MQVVILDDDAGRRGALAHALYAKGFEVAVADSQEDAVSRMRRGFVDLLILRHWIGGRATLSAALAAEFHNPQVATLLLSDHGGSDADELFELIPSISSILGEATDPALIARLAVAAGTAGPRLLARQERVWPEGPAPSPVFVSRRKATAAARPIPA